MLKHKSPAAFGLPIFLMTAISLAAGLAGGLAGCTKSSPKTQYYVFDTLTKPAKTREGMQLVEVRPVELPNYLEQRNLVMRDGSAKLIVSQNHLWADDPEASITRELVNSLNSLSNSRHYQADCSTCTEIQVVIEHFYPTIEGEVVLSGEYSVGGNSVFDIPFSFTGDLERDGYEEAVRVMRMLIGELAQQIDNEATIPDPMANDG